MEFLNNDLIKALPLLPTRNLVIMPDMSISFDVSRKASINAVQFAMKNNTHLILSAQKDVTVDEPKYNDLYDIGTAVKVKQIFKMSEPIVRVLVEGLYRVKILDTTLINGRQVAQVVKIEDKKVTSDKTKVEATLRVLKELFHEYCSYIQKPPTEVITRVIKEKDIGKLCDFITANSLLEYDKKQMILEETDVIKRANLLSKIIDQEINILGMEHEISVRVKEEIDQNQREYYLKEQLKVIQNELGDDIFEEVEKFAFKIESIFKDKPEIKEKLLKEVDRYSKMPPMSHEGTVVRNYLETVLDMPFGIKTKETLNLDKVKRKLDKDHFGLTKVKERILEEIAIKKLSGKNGQIICLVGPPGVGKTSIAKSIADAIGRNFQRVSLGGIHDEAEIRGHRRTYIGAMPGRIANAIRQSKSSNPLILLDEIDKLSNDYHGDPSSALLEVLDSEQNKTFVDHFLDIEFDLSDVMFIVTANSLDTISRPLLDRFEVIEIDSYLENEKAAICKKHLIPKNLLKYGFEKNAIKFTGDAIFEIIDGYTREAGVRQLERNINKILRKCAKLYLSNKKQIKISKSDIEKYLGTRKFLSNENFDQSICGIANGLAWTSVGGTMLNVEVLVMEGSGKIELTGSLGDVMKESAKIAVDHVRNLSDIYEIDKDFYKTKDIHIHFPEGAVPKDGPSAGITIVTAIFSAISKIPVNNKIAMTGEVTLTGRVLPIGGLKEKVMAAYKNKINTVIIPKDNLKDLNEIDKTIKEKLNFISVSNVSEVIEKALLFTPDKRKNQNNNHLINEEPARAVVVEQ